MGQFWEAAMEWPKDYFVNLYNDGTVSFPSRDRNALSTVAETVRRGFPGLTGWVRPKHRIAVLYVHEKARG